jgi:hypothetical protein
MVAVAALMASLNSGHWIMEENPQATVKLAADFLAK